MVRISIWPIRLRSGQTFQPFHENAKNSGVGVILRHPDLWFGQRGETAQRDEFVHRWLEAGSGRNQARHPAESGSQARPEGI